MLKKLCALALCITMLLGAGAHGESLPERLPDAQLITYYDDSAFVGDSMIRVFRTYVADVVQRENPAYFESTRFFGVINYTLYAASLYNPPENYVNISYRGEQVSLVQLMRSLKPGKLFVLVGMNDYIAEKPDKGMTYVERIVTRVAEVSPETQVYFFSLTPVTAKVVKKAPDRQQLWDEYNVLLAQKCAELGAVYVDIATALKGEDGLLPDDISDDGEYHLNNDGNARWLQALMDFAQQEYEAGRWTPAQ